MKNHILIISIIICFSTKNLSCRAQDPLSSRDIYVTQQKTIGIESMLNLIFTMSFDGLNIYFPIIIQTPYYQGYAITTLESIESYCYDINKISLYDKNAKKFVKHIKKILIEQQPLILDTICNWYFSTFVPIDSIFLYEEDQSSQFIIQAFTENASLKITDYEWETTILKMFRWGYLLCGPSSATKRSIHLIPINDFIKDSNYKIKFAKNKK